MIAALLLTAASTPSPTPTTPPDFNPDTVTPGFVGFIITFLIAVVVVLLILDMVRRIRRVRYRDEIRQLLDEEQLRALDEDVDPKAGGDDTSKPGSDTPDDSR